VPTFMGEPQVPSLQKSPLMSPRRDAGTLQTDRGTDRGLNSTVWPPTPTLGDLILFNLLRLYIIIGHLLLHGSAFAPHNSQPGSYPPRRAGS
jgi:hypothetical protein